MVKPFEISLLATHLVKTPPQWTNWKLWYMSQLTNRQLAKENPITEPYEGRPDVDKLQRFFGVPIKEIDMPPGWLFALINPDGSGGMAALEDGTVFQIIFKNGAYIAVESKANNED